MCIHFEFVNISIISVTHECIFNAKIGVVLIMDVLCIITDIDDCINDPCMHGECCDGVDKYVCNCHPGYTGINCDERKYTSISLYDQYAHHVILYILIE